MQLIEKQVQDALAFTEAHLAVPALPPHARKQLEGQRNAYRDVLRWIAEIQEDWDNSLRETVGEANLRFIQWARRHGLSHNEVAQAWESME